MRPPEVIGRTYRKRMSIELPAQRLRQRLGVNKEGDQEGDNEAHADTDGEELADTSLSRWPPMSR